MSLKKNCKTIIVHNNLNNPKSGGIVPLKLYLFMASHNDGEVFSFSPTEFSKKYNVNTTVAGRSFAALVENNYIIPKDGNNYDFYIFPLVEEKPNEIGIIDNIKRGI
jgi:hypothetical protein